MTDLISVIIPTYNPNAASLQRTLQALQKQTLPVESWELVIIDNNSRLPVNPDIHWHPRAKVVTEPRPGLTNARLRGFSLSSGNLIVMVDDDNVLDEDYLQNAIEIFARNEKLGAAGGRSLPEFAVQPPRWVNEFYSNLALRDLGESVLTASWNGSYPKEAPIGAGMVMRRSALTAYVNKEPMIADRTAGTLTSGGDNDIVLEILKSGWDVGYFPQLRLTHLVPAERTTKRYLAKLINHTNRSWVQLLASHGINPWKSVARSSVPLRKLKAWFTYKAWQSPAAYIKWRGACGLFDGLAECGDVQ